MDITPTVSNFIKHKQISFAKQREKEQRLQKQAEEQPNPARVQQALNRVSDIRQQLENEHENGRSSKRPVGHDFEHYGLPPITGKTTLEGNARCVIRLAIPHRQPRRRRNMDLHLRQRYGNGLGYKTRGKPFNEVCREIDALIGNTFRRDKIPEASDASKLRKKVLSNFAKMSPLRGTCAAEYLNSRGIYQLPAESVRLNPKQRHNGRVYQSIYSLATDDKGELCYLHQTLWMVQKADIGASAKRQKSLQEDNYLDHARSVAIRMFPVASTLGIAEGIETALSAHQIYKVNTGDYDRQFYEEIPGPGRR